MEKDKNGKLNAGDIFAALKQDNLTVNDLAKDLKQIFDDYFVGVCKLIDSRLEIQLLNGQKFSITVKEN